MLPSGSDLDSISDILLPNKDRNDEYVWSKYQSVNGLVVIWFDPKNNRYERSIKMREC